MSRPSVTSHLLKSKSLVLHSKKVNVVDKSEQPEAKKLDSILTFVIGRKWHKLFNLKSSQIVKENIHICNNYLCPEVEIFYCNSCNCYPQ